MGVCIATASSSVAAPLAWDPRVGAGSSDPLQSTGSSGSHALREITPDGSPPPQPPFESQGCSRTPHHLKSNDSMSRVRRDSMALASITSDAILISSFKIGSSNF